VDLAENVFERGHGDGKENPARKRWQVFNPNSARKLLWRRPARVDSIGSRLIFRRMITLSRRAADRIRALQTELNAPTKRLRVLVESGGCSGFQYGMSFDEPKADDQQMESEGVGFIIDPASFAYLDGSSIDFDDGLHGKGFEIKNPNAQSTCGCGKSFS
jgi:iron-sulfur cluster assembly protein/iron-sulfur cluster insertion protein